MNQGIPTIGPKEIQFRSKIEAQWAYLFQSFGWNWEYEPYELKGYIPDFLITMNKVQILIEIKGDNNIWEEYNPHLKKIRDSGWKGVVIILGSTFKESNSNYNANVGIISFVREGSSKLEKYDDVCIRFSDNTNRWDFGGNMMEYDYDFSCNYWKEDSHETYEKFSKMWSIAKNLTQWKGKQNLNNKHNKTVQSVYKNFIEEEPEPKCWACQDSGISYWSDGCYGACMNCSAHLIDQISCYDEEKVSMQERNRIHKKSQEIYNADRVNL